METYRNFWVVIEHPAFGRVLTRAEFDGESIVKFGEGVSLDIGKAISRDMKRFEEMNKGLEPTDKNYIDISTMQLSDVNIDGHLVNLGYVFQENWYNGKKCGGRCARGDAYEWSTSGECKRTFKLLRPVFGFDAFVGW